MSKYCRNPNNESLCFSASVRYFEGNSILTSRHIKVLIAPNDEALLVAFVGKRPIELVFAEISRSHDQLRFGQSN